ncbi:hypothetical protein [Denitrobaculum tricleocarpae]|uniref:Uncharacterized protein n=1 Tax=Denitrobaculum tricleocarpae TaxID=2591009 RepID=A0A545U2C0_9PROT|nr:hypothetical protein [Denitrobaculum tricleocarpae]TQV83608.1 hypothetical protein FKG95_03180 [Denitrobaculum tricleocarpae]
MSDKREQQTKWVIVFWCVLLGGLFVWYHGDWFRCLTEHWVYRELVKWQTGIAAIIGLGVIWLGYQFNASLNRDNAYTIAQLDRERDDRIRLEEARSLAIALAAEVKMNAAAVEILHNEARKFEKRKEVSADELFKMQYWMARKPRTVTYHDIGAKMGLFPASLVDQIAEFYTALEEAAEFYTSGKRHEDRALATQTSEPHLVSYFVDKELLKNMIDKTSGSVSYGLTLRTKLHDFAKEHHFDKREESS